MYQRMRQAALRRRQATPSRGFTGGMAEQQTQALSAAEMQQLGNLGRAREQALREERTGRQSAFSNALIAGQQQADYARMLQDAAFARQQTIEGILANEDLDEAATTRLLGALGESAESARTLQNLPTTEGATEVGIQRVVREAARTGNKSKAIREIMRLRGVTRDEANDIYREQFNLLTSGS
jgi:hypothetical protein